MPAPPVANTERALRDFVRARNQATMRELLARLRGESDELLSYNEVCRHLATHGRPIHKGIEEIPLHAIVGSVGRYKDFTRDFLPKSDGDRERWTRVRASLDDMHGWTPIEVYQVGAVYFVVDGNHRVSVARRLGQNTITAHVTVVPINADITAEDDPDEIIAKARYAEFLDKTRLDQLRPDADLYLTFHTQYELLLDGIAAYAELLDAPGPLEPAAVAGWYDHVYMPVVRVMRRQQTALDFPERSEADLFVLVTRRRETLADELGWQIDPADAALALAANPEPSRRPWSRLGRLLFPGRARPADDGPPPLGWRQHKLQAHPDRLFADVLVNVQGTAADWRLLDHAVQVAQLDGGRILGVFVGRTAAERDGKEARAIEERFLDQVAAAGLAGEFARTAGAVETVLVQRARYVDLVVTNLTGPYRRSLLQFTSGPERLIQHCPRPLLLWRDGCESPLDRALLAYDGSPKAEEALYLAVYLAQRRRVALDVVTVVTDYTPADVLDRARAYIGEEHGLPANYLLRDRPITAAILQAAEECRSNWVIMGGFGFTPMRYLMLGSTVSEIIPAAQWPILVCR